MLLNGSSVCRTERRKIETKTTTEVVDVYYDCMDREIGRKTISHEVHIPEGWHPGTW